MCKRYQFLSVVLSFLLLGSGYSLYAQEKGQDQDDKQLIIYESELTKLMQIIAELETINNERLSEAKRLLQESAEREKYWIEYESAMQNQIKTLKLTNSIMAGGIIAAATAVIIVLIVK